VTAYELDDTSAELFEARVTPDEAAAVLWHYDDAGNRRNLPEPGSFVQALIACIARADPQNRLRLALGFGGYVAAASLVEGRRDGITRLRKRAKMTR
jgi:hypothetical protein